MEKLAKKYGGEFQKNSKLDVEDTLGEGYLARMQEDLDSINPGQKAVDALVELMATLV